MRVAFLLDWEPTAEQITTLQDGITAAMAELAKRHEVQFFTVGRDTIIFNPLHDIIMTSDPVKSIAEWEPDVILHWADTTRPHAIPLFELGKPMALCFAGGEPLGETYPYFEHIFVESQVYKDVYDKVGVSNSIAFGTNTDLFRPLPEQPKLFDTINLSTFAAWKRHDLYAAAVQGLRSIAAGYIYQNHEQECWQECLRLGTMILPHVPADVARYLMAASRVCVITSMSSGGSQRTVLEAMAMNLPLIITDSDKYDYAHDSGKVFVAEPTAESIRGYINAILDGEQNTNTRDYVLENWSHIRYAEALEDGLKQII